MNTVRELGELAAATGFRPDALEKVQKLLMIVKRLDENELSRGQWALKGGTALNLFFFDVPRLSVDIDINFVGVTSVDELQRARTSFERALEASCARSGCSVRRAPFEHAGGKFRLRYSSLLGGEQNLEVDVSYVARVPLFGIERRRCLLHELSSENVPLLSLPELAAGKFAALLSRHAARDFFDALQLIELEPSLLEQREFRLALVTQVGGARHDLRHPKLRAELSRNELETQLMPLLRIQSGSASHDAATLVERFRTRVHPVAQKVIQWTDGEARFLDRLLDDGEIEPAHLTDDRTIQERISRQPMLLWKQKNVRAHKGFDTK